MYVSLERKKKKKEAQFENHGALRKNTKLRIKTSFDNIKSVTLSFWMNHSLRCIPRRW